MNLKNLDIQFPLISVSAIIIHKSQGGTFDEVVYAYDRRHEQSLVYVALSRVSSLRGLYSIAKNFEKVGKI